MSASVTLSQLVLYGLESPMSVSVTLLRAVVISPTFTVGNWSQSILFAVHNKGMCECQVHNMSSMSELQKSYMCVGICSEKGAASEHLGQAKLNFSTEFPTAKSGFPWLVAIHS